MAEYWVKTSADAQAEGPLSAVEVKRRAAAGEIARDALISMDNITWHPAARVKGLFPAPAAPVTPPMPQTVATAGWDQPISGNGASEALPAPARLGGLPPAYPRTQRQVVESSRMSPADTVPPPAPPTPASTPTRTSSPPSTVSPPPPMVESGDGTIESQAPMPMQPPMPPLTPPPLSSPAAPRGVIPPWLGYATPGVTGAGAIRPRRTNAFFVVAILMFVVGIVHAYGMYVSFTVSRPRPLDILLLIGSNLLWLGLSCAAIALWVMWLAGVHKDMQVLTAGQYEVSPAKAAGFMFIPVFNAFWVVFAPTKLAGAANMQLEASGQPKISSGAVTACQIISVVAPFVGLYALTPLMYAISMRIIQRGFNQLAANQYKM